MVELARLESVYRRNPIKGSNPFPSADITYKIFKINSLYILFYGWVQFRVRFYNVQRLHIYKLARKFNLD